MCMRQTAGPPGRSFAPPAAVFIRSIHPKSDRRKGMGLGFGQADSAQAIFWPQLVPRRTGGTHRRHFVRTGRFGRDADGRRKIGLLPASGADAPGDHRGGLASDFSDEGPGRSAHPGRHSGGVFKQLALARAAARGL